MNEDILTKLVDALAENPSFCERTARLIEVDPAELLDWAERQQDEQED